MITDLALPLEDQRVPITAELRGLGPRQTGAQFALVATPRLFETMVLEPLAENQSDASDAG